MEGGLHVPDDRTLRILARLGVRLRAVDDRERCGPVVDELADGLGLGQTRAVEADPPLQLFGIDEQREGQEAESLAAGDLVGLGARRGAPKRRMGPLERLRDYPAGRDREVLALPGKHVVRPRADDDVERLLPELAGLLRIDAERFDLVARDRATGAELEPAIAD